MIAIFNYHVDPFPVVGYYRPFYCAHTNYALITKTTNNIFMWLVRNKITLA